VGAVKETTGKPKRVGDGTPGPGRPKGIPNKTTKLLKDAILEAATKAGGRDGLVGYLKTQASQNPQSFMPLLGKVLPLQLHGPDDDDGNPTTPRIEVVLVQAAPL
jgi:hypothetical protein